MLLRVLLFSLASAAFIRAGTPVPLTIDPRHTLAPGADRKLGINVDYLMDNDRDWRPAAPRRTEDALREMGVRWLRFPGGEKSDSYLWSVPPFARPQPALARTGPAEWPAGDRRFTLDDHATYRIATLGFDDFVAMCRRLGAEPVCVVALDSCYKPATAAGRAPTKAELLASAVAWVRYANVARGYGVKYWEIGNEGFLATQNGNPPSAAVYGRDIAEFARAMKAVDPTIEIGANGDKESWWRDLLPAAGADIDFLVAHDYPCWEWGRFERYRTWRESLTPATDIALRAIRQFAAPGDRDRLRVAATEFNAADWSRSNPWPNDNDLGHALVLTEMIGDYLANPRVLAALLWNTRWIDQPHPAENTLWDALDADNRLNASGLALALWRHAALDRMIAVSGRTDLVRAFAALSADRHDLSLVVINKSEASVVIDVVLAPDSLPSPMKISSRRTLRGSTPADRRPILSLDPPSPSPDLGRIALPAHSATVLRLSGAAE